MDLHMLNTLVQSYRPGIVISTNQNNIPPVVEISLVTAPGQIPTCESIAVRVITKEMVSTSVYFAQFIAVREITSSIIPWAFVSNTKKYTNLGLGRNIILKPNYQSILICVATPDREAASAIMNYWISSIAEHL